MSTQADLNHLELLAEVDALLADLREWSDEAPDWPPARYEQALVRRLFERADLLRLRLSAPLVVATLGGTGVGKSTLVNALVGHDVSLAGRQRPTTREPTLVCRPDITPEMLGIDPATVRLVHCDAPALRDLVLLDCPDPDTTEDAESPATNLARLRHLLPHCDVLLVVSTQQKYRSARVGDELAAAASGARLVFVQTRADVDENILDDWRQHLGRDYAPGEMFFVDSLAALADHAQGIRPRGDFGRLLDLLERELAGAAGHRIRQANLVDLGRQTLAGSRQRIDEALPKITQLEAGLMEQRARLATRLAQQAHDELLSSRRAWENRLLAEVANRWGFSPFSLVLRIYQGLGALATSAALLRVRSPVQLALLGAVEAGRRWTEHRSRRRADAATSRAVAASFDPAELRTATIVVDGYLHEAELPRGEQSVASLQRQLGGVGDAFVKQAAAELQSLVGELALRHSGLFTRCRYELALLLVAGVLLYRFSRNFFYDSWLAPELGWAEAQPLLGIDFFLGAALVLVVWCGLLLWFFTARLRRGLQARISMLAQRWNSPAVVAGLFDPLEQQCRKIRRWRQQLDQLDQRLLNFQNHLATQPSRLGHLRVGERIEERG